MITAVTVDDEKAGRDNLKALVGKYCPQVKIIGEAADPREAKQVLDNLQPQLAFLDIEMPFGTSFDLLSDYEHIPFQVIFVTAFERYALQALRLSACDYILKPIEIAELVTAVNKATDRIENKKVNEQLTILLSNLKSLDKDRKVALPTSTGMVFVRVLDIVRCQADAAYCWFYFTNGSKMLVTHNIGEYEELLGSKDFIRVHHGDLINRYHVVELISGKAPIVKMSDGAAITVSVRKRDALEQLIDGKV